MYMCICIFTLKPNINIKNIYYAPAQTTKTTLLFICDNGDNNLKSLEDFLLMRE